MGELAADGSVVIEITGDDSKFKKTLGALGGVASGALKGTVAAIGAVGTALTAAGGYAIKVGSDFEAGMSKVQAISGASSADMERLSAVAKEMGSTTKFSATESADALSYMAMAGWKTEQMVSGLPGIMHLAAASGEDLASVSDIVTDALTAFGLQASDSAHFADVLAKAASSSNTTVGLMGSTFQYVAPLAGAMGYSVEDTATAIGLMANAGIKGGQAGTALRSMFTRLAKPPKDAAAAIEALGLKTTDAGGRMLPLSDVMEQLRASFSGLSEEQKIQMASSLAGQEAMSGLLAIVNASDEDFDKLSGEISNASGAAEAMAGVMNDNLQGAMTIAKSALEGLGISLYQDLQAPAKEAVKTFSDMVAQLQSAFDRGGLEGMVRAAGDVMAQLAAKIAGAAPGMAGAAVSLLQSFLAGIQNNLPALAEGAVSMVASLAAGVIELLPQIADTGTKLILRLAQSIIEGLPGMVPAAVQTIASLVENLTGNLGQIIDAGLQIIVALGEGIIEALPDLIEKVPEIVSNIANVINDNAPKLLLAAAKLIVELGVGLMKSISALVANIPKIIQAVVDAWTAFSWLDLGKSAITAIKNGIANMLPAIKTAGKNVLDSIVNAIKALPQTLAGIGRNGVSGLANAVRGLAGTARSAMASVVDGIVGSISKLPSKMLSIGKDIVSGIVRGIKNGAVAAVNAVADLANSVINKAKSVFKINSPSRAMRDEVGKPIPAGMGEGITDGLPRMERDVATQLAAFTKRLRAAVQGEAVGASARLSAPGGGGPGQAAALPNSFVINVYPGRETSVPQARDIGREVGAEAAKEMRRRGVVAT